MANQITYGDKSRQAILRGVDRLANTVKVTLGPQGRNVILEKSYGSPIITKDGVSVAKEIDLPDPIENMGAQMVKEVASKTSEVAGDGTTTATVLAQAIYREGARNVTAGADPMILRRGIEKAVAAISAELLRMAKIDEFTALLPRQLSGGMRQRVAICRALVHDPSILLMDEPFSALDAITRDEMGVELLRIWQANRKTVIFVTHSIREAAFLSDRVLVMGRRPATIIDDLAIDLPRPRHIAMTEDEAFNRLVRHLRKAIEASHAG